MANERLPERSIFIAMTAKVRGDATDAEMTNSVAGTIHPGSESGTCFRTNRSCRRVPAHQGMKIGCKWENSSVIATTLPSWSGLRRNDDWGAGLTKGCRMANYE